MPRSFAALNVDNVEAGGSDANIFQGRQSLHGATINGHFVGERRVCTLQTINNLIARGSFVEGGFAKCLDVIPRKVSRVERVTVQHHNFHAGRE